MNKPKKIGLLVNPLAGIGGSVGLKGSDGEEIVKMAFERGAKPLSPARTLLALEELLPLKDKIQFITADGDMGHSEASHLGFDTKVVYKPTTKTSYKDTEAALKVLMKEDIDILIFSGGDGTARNVYNIIENNICVIGIPAGVKIHSAVYGTTPKNAGRIAFDCIADKVEEFKDAEVMDLDEDLYRKGIVSPRLYGYMKIPSVKKGMQNVKAKSVSTVVTLDSIATDIVGNMKDDVYYIIGAGTTTRNIMGMLKLENTLIGIDVVCNKKLVANDVYEKELWELIQSRKCVIVLTPIGGQGHILGRGNQQISPRIIKYVGKDNIEIIATKEKLLSLKNRNLIVDTGDAELDKELSGYKRIITGIDERVVCPVGM